jgi:hypothetical protein
MTENNQITEVKAIYQEEASMTLCITHDGMGVVRTAEASETLNPGLLITEFLAFLESADEKISTGIGTLWYFRSTLIPFTLINKSLHGVPPSDYRMIVVSNRNPEIHNMDLGRWKTNPWNVRREVVIAFDDVVKQRYLDHAAEVAKDSATEYGMRVSTKDVSRVEITKDGAWVPLKLFMEKKELPTDVHTEAAAKMFGIPTSEVSPEQRNAAKTAFFAENYLDRRYGGRRGGGE